MEVGRLFAQYRLVKNFFCLKVLPYRLFFFTKTLFSKQSKNINGWCAFNAS